jgi:hypothetical protein
MIDTDCHTITKRPWHLYLYNDLSYRWIWNTKISNWKNNWYYFFVQHLIIKVFIIINVKNQFLFQVFYQHKQKFRLDKQHFKYKKNAHVMTRKWRWMIIHSLGRIARINLWENLFQVTNWVYGHLRPINRQLMLWHFQIQYSYLHSNVIMSIDVYCHIIDKMTLVAKILK